MWWTKTLKSCAVRQFLGAFAATFCVGLIALWLFSAMSAERNDRTFLSVPASDDGTTIATSQSDRETNSKKPADLNATPNLSVSNGRTPDSGLRDRVAGDSTQSADDNVVQQTRLSNGAAAGLANAAVDTLIPRSPHDAVQLYAEPMAATAAGASLRSGSLPRSQAQGNEVGGYGNSLASSPSADERRVRGLFTQEQQIYRALHGWGAFSAAEDPNSNP
jgi:hypothetical protein